MGHLTRVEMESKWNEYGDEYALEHCFSLFFLLGNFSDNSILDFEFLIFFLLIGSGDEDGR